MLGPRWMLLLVIAATACAAPPPVAPTVTIAPSEQATPAPVPPPSAEPAAPEAPAPEAAPPKRDCVKVPPQKGAGVLPGKQAAVEGLLKGQSVKIVLDARRAHVLVPSWLAHDGKLMLQVGYAMAVPIPDLKTDAAGFSGTLSFDRQPFFVSVPWSAVYAAVGADDRRGWVWRDDVPEDQRCK